MSQIKTNTAIVFPGQGSQSVGMISELYEEFSTVRDCYTEASDVLGFELWELTKNGPSESLNQTINTQPAMLVSGVACWRVLQEKSSLIPAYFAGHSLGEYTALVASGQLEFAEAVLLARKRAESMQSAVPAGIGAMAAIIGLESETINAVCADVSTDGSKVWSANDNAPGQIVIAGERAAVERACEALKEAGAKRALLLSVSVPSHCPLMQPAADEMKEAFMLAKWSKAKAPVIHNCDVKEHAAVGDIVTALTEQLISPVRWVEIIQYLSSKGVTNVIEVGPGKVLAGLNKRIDKTMTAQSVFDMASLEGVLKTINE
ncbi:MAG: ACP S-malonyltransferase [Gammaproteobacteria bacterium]|nr:ACP S-malonyltransferase [Gammaproteobacteria bacterium]